MSWTPIWMFLWQGGSVVTFVYLTFFAGYHYTWWNWLIAVPVNIFLGEIWPIYFAILRPIFGA